MKAPKIKHSPSSSSGLNGSDATASTSAHAAGTPYPSKLLACVACRNSKVKCISDHPEQCKRCLDHGLTCIRPEYQRLKKAKAKLARFQQQANLGALAEDKSSSSDPASMDVSEPLPPERPILPQESPTTLFSNASYGKSAQLLSNLHIVRPDVRDEWDPVAAGIMDLETSQTLFNTFMVKLEALLSFFDPRIHTYDYIRSHSCLLFTTMCWLASTVSAFPDAPRVMHDLKLHIDNVLLPAIYCQNLRSVEIVQGFLMLAAYLRPAQNPSEDRSWTLLGHAIRVATDLDMHSRALSTSQQHQASNQASSTPTPSSGLAGAPSETDAAKQHEIWHQRNRERAWMHIWLHEASSSQYTGRVSLLSKDPIVESSRGWHLHPEALHTDVVFVALIELRSQLAQNKELFRMLSSRSGPASNGSTTASGSGSSTPGSNEADSSWIRHYLDRCHRDLSSWEERWVVNPSRSASHPRPLRFELGSLYICYARMQLLSLPLQWPTLPPSMATRIVSDLHSVSIRYLEDFIDRTSPQRLAHSYNSICVTATYAVVIALKLTKLAATYTFINSSKIIQLVTRVSEYLRKGGNWTPHQNGSSLSYARYIDRLLDMESNSAPQHQSTASNGAAQTTNRNNEAYAHSGRRPDAEGGQANDNSTARLPHRYRLSPGMSPGEPTNRAAHAPSLQRAHSGISHPLSSPRTIYTATPGSDAGLFPRISASPHAQGVPPVVPGPTTPSSHFALPPGVPTPLSGAGAVAVDPFQYATAPGVEPGHPQWSFLANDPELFAWARSFLNDELDLTVPGASFN
ncbi:hypothetical protein PANT_6c00137 [Moesziomyces antarcticus T-34]|uniref:Zn(2)-C6 fungal-type domain-containing protein n=1 Tax=Pseudozyma antarctica (strain T-34) TaxID=1151754 RepID=M9MD25_PSEA3|nr:hypothetical protein PANT_6c00137 [Moesziomyces antarcticus T-34]